MANCGTRVASILPRAVLQDPGLLILDEATSALDGITEQHLLERLAPFFAERTVIVIAHHRAAIRGVDRILLLDSGRLVADGTHEILQGDSALYRRLWQKTLSDPVEEIEEELPEERLRAAS